MKLALTPIYIPFIPKAYIYPATLVGPIMLLVAIYMLFFTRFGRTVYAIGSNEQSALLMVCRSGVPRFWFMHSADFVQLWQELFSVYRYWQAMDSLRPGWSLMPLPL